MHESDVHLATFDGLDARTAYLLWQLRESVFVVEQSCPYSELDGRDLEPTTQHVWLEHEGMPIAYLRILQDPDVVRVGRVLVAQRWRGQRLAQLLMRRALAHIGERASRLDAQSYLAQWYAGFGFEIAGPEFFEDGIAHLPMRRPSEADRS